MFQPNFILCTVNTEDNVPHYIIFIHMSLLRATETGYSCSVHLGSKRSLKVKKCQNLLKEEIILEFNGRTQSRQVINLSSSPEKANGGLGEIYSLGLHKWTPTTWWTCSHMVGEEQGSWKYQRKKGRNRWREGERVEGREESIPKLGPALGVGLTEYI